MTRFEEDMRQMVEHAGDSMSQEKRTLAMNYVRAVGNLANGSRGSLEALCDAMVVQQPIILGMFLQPSVTKADVDAVVARHASQCKESCQGIAKRGQGGTGPLGLNWQRLLFATLANLSWPAAIVIVTIAVVFKEPLILWLSKL